MNTSKDQHLASQKRLQFAVRKLANSSENIRFDRSKLYIFVELAHIYFNSSTNSANKFTFCEMWSILRNVKPANWRKSCELGNAIGMLTTIWQKFRWNTDGILITAEKFGVRTHHNALRFISVSHITVGLAQARPNNTRRQRLHNKNCTTCSRLFETAMNNVLLPILFNVVNNIVQLHLIVG